MITNSENKAFRYIRKQLAQINDINMYHGKDDIEHSVSIINSLKKCAKELIDNGANETSVNKWLDEMLDCFKEQGFTYEEIAQLLGITKKKVDNTIQRIRYKFKKGQMKN